MPPKAKYAIGAGFALLVGVTAFLDDLLEARPLRAADFLLAALLSAIAAAALLLLDRMTSARERHAEVARRRRDGLRALGALHEDGELHNLLDRVAGCASEISDVALAAVAVRDGDGEMVLRASRGEGLPALGTRLPSGAGIAAAVAQRGPLLAAGNGDEPLLRGDQLMPAAAAVAAAPIGGGEDTRGLIAIGVRRPGQRLGQGDLDAVRELADLAGLAIEQVILRERTKSQLRAHVEAFALALDVRDQYTASHSDQVVEMAVEVGRRLGLPTAALAELEMAARMHDIGKLGVPDAILNKQGPLDRSEWAVMREHATWGAELLTRVPGLERVAEIVGAGHERWDGEGYPSGIAGAEIPRESRIIFACDAFHAMTSSRPYRAAMGFDEALAELRRCAGTQFDPAVVGTLAAALLTDRPLPARTG